MIPLEQIMEAARLIGHKINRTPLVHSPYLSGLFGAEIYLKLENLQKTGAFKLRGAAVKMFSGRTGIKPLGVVAASAGNHAQGVALAASQAGIPAAIVMPEWASISKRSATRDFGGEVIIAGNSVEESLEHAEELAREGRTFIHPFDDEEIIAGQGTIALEVFQDLNDVDYILCPIGGGGLISGIGSAARAISPKTRIIGIEPACCSSTLESIRLDRPAGIEAGQSIADGITVKKIGRLTFEIIKDCVDEVVTVDEERIAEAVLILLEKQKVLSEGAGAVGLAALLGGAVRLPEGSRAVLIVSGGNVDSPLIGRILRRGLIKNGRVMKVVVALEDTPGRLAGLSRAVAELKANVIHLGHDRFVDDLPFNMSRVVLELETSGGEHIAEIRQGLRERGFSIE